MKLGLFFAFLLPFQSAASETRQQNAEASTGSLSICQLRHLEKSIREQPIYLRATYFTDLRHGAFFTDEGCPGFSIQRGITPENVDKGVRAFDDAVAGNVLVRDERRFEVEVIGVLVDDAGSSCGFPEEGRTSKECSFVVQKVVSFRRIMKSDD